MLVFNNASTTMHDTVVDFAYSHDRRDMSNFEFEARPNESEFIRNRKRNSHNKKPAASQP